MSASDIHRALEAHYTTDRRQWVLIPEARSGAGFEGNNGQCDLIAINTWPSQGVRLIGHEIKVSHSDWKRELATAEKVERFSRHCETWWVVAPAELAQRIKAEGDLPPAWGLMAVDDAGKITKKVTAPKNPTPVGVPTWWWIGWMAQLDRRRHATVAREVAERIAPTLEAERERDKQRLESDVQRRVQALQHKVEMADMLAETLGIRLDNVNHWDLENVGRLVALRNRIHNVTGMAEQLRLLASALDPEEVAS